MCGLRKNIGILEDSDFGIINKKEISDMADFVKKNNNRKYNNKKNSNTNSKNKNFNNRKTNYNIPADVYAEPIEYKMSKQMADGIIKDAKGKGNPQVLLCDFVNTQFGLKGYCVRVIVS